MPYREAPEGAPCHQCERLARATCPCCQRPTCPRHLQKLCGKCDEALYRYSHRDDGGRMGLQLMGVLAASAVPAIITTTLLPVTIAAVFLALPGLLWYRSRKDVRTFLALMRTRGALPEGSASISEDEAALAKYEAKVAARRLEHVGSPTDDPGAGPEPDRS